MRVLSGATAPTDQSGSSAEERKRAGGWHDGEITCDDGSLSKSNVGQCRTSDREVGVGHSHGYGVITATEACAQIDIRGAA